MPFLISTPNYEYVFGPYDSRKTAKTAQGKIGSVLKATVRKETGNYEAKAPEIKIEEAQFEDGWYCIRREDGSCTRIRL